MTTVTIDIEKLNTAVEAMEELAGSIDSQRNSAASATPIALPSLSGLARKAQWLRDNVSELTSRRELARLLDTEGSGSATYEVSSDTQANVDDLLSSTLADALSDIDADSSQEEIDRVNGVMSDLTDDSTVMAKTFEHLGADGTAGTMSNMIEAMRDGGDYESLLTLATTFRTGLSTASNSDEWARRPDYPHGGTYAENFALALTRASVPIPGYESDGLLDDITTGSRSSGLTFLLQDSRLSRDFVKGAADGLDQFETTFEDEDSMWDSATDWYSQYSVSPLTPRDIGFDDPMAAVMDGMARHPDLGLEWFRTGINGDRQTRYFNDRDWSNDGYGSISAAAESISTDPGNLETDPENTTKLASNFIDLVANSPGFNAEDAKAASPHIADLLEFYTPAVDQALRNGEDEGDGNSVPFELDHFGSFDHYPEFFRNDLDSVMQVAMGTPEGMTSIANGVGSFQQTQLNNAAVELGLDPDDPGVRTQLRGVLERTSALQGFTEFSVGEVEIEGARDRDAQRQAYIDLVGDAAGLVPIPGADQLGDLGGKLVDYGWSQTQDLATNSASEHFASETAGATDHADTRAEEGTNRIKINAYLSLVRSGVIPESEVSDQWFDDGELISAGDVPADDMSQYTQSAMSGVGQYATDMDLETSYRDSFLSYYQPASED